MNYELIEKATVSSYTPEQLAELRNPHRPACTRFPACANAEVVQNYEQGRVTCTNCGTTLSGQVISDASEIRVFADDDKDGPDPTRTGGPEHGLLGNLGLATGAIEGMGRYQKNPLTSAQRHLLKAISFCESVARDLHMSSSIVTKAGRIYKRVYETEKLRGLAYEDQIVACLWFACAKTRSFKELCGVADREMKKVNKCRKRIKQLNIFKSNKDKGNGRSALSRKKPNQVAESMPRHCGSLSLDITAEKCGTHIANKVQHYGLLEGKQPATVAGAVLWMMIRACGKDGPDGLQPKHVSKVTGQAKSTIMQAYMTLEKSWNSLVPPEYKKGTVGTKV